LTESEAALFDHIRTQGDTGRRLEQERLTSDAVTAALLSWRD